IFELARIKFNKVITEDVFSTIKLNSDPDYNYYSNSNGEMYAIDQFIHQDKFDNKKLILYPNPVENRLTISFSNFENVTSGELSIFNLEGKHVSEEKININTSGFGYQIDVSHLSPNQIYYIEYKTSEKVYSSRFVKL
ncbi:MAG: T9SS type A sorting domain-containing protein, partial [Saprospiraceae bacterium]